MRDGWRRVLIGDIVRQVRRRVEVLSGNEYRLLGMRWYGQGPFHRETVLGNTAKPAAYFRVATGDLIYNRLFAWKGAFGVIPPDLDGSFVSGEFPVFEVDESQATPAFLNLVLCRPDVWEKVLRESTGSTATSRNRWNESRFLVSDVLLPPLAEQQRIVDLIDHVGEVHGQATAVAQSVRELGNALRNDWFKIRLPGKPLRSVVEVTNGRLRNPLNANGPHMTRYVRAANVQDGRLEMDAPMYMNFSPKEQARYALRAGDVLVTEGSGSRASIGASCEWNGEIPGVVCFQNHLLRLRPLSTSGLPSAFVYQWALWSHRTGRFAEIAAGTNILSLGVDRVSEMLVPLDELHSIDAFVSTMQAFDNAERAARALVAAATGARGGILAALLSGDHEVPASYDQFLDSAA